MTLRTAAHLVSSAQRRTATRRDAHFALVGEIERMALDARKELRLRDAVYRRLFPEYADCLADNNADTGEAEHA
jgi:hypothetical protein